MHSDVVQVMRNNAKSAVSDLEYQCSMVRQEKQQLAAELQVLQESAAELQVQCQCHLEDKRQLKAVLSETQRHLSDVENRLAEMEQALTDEKRLRTKEVLSKIRGSRSVDSEDSGLLGYAVLLDEWCPVSEMCRQSVARIR